jgi:hypothetical protein
MTHHKNKGKIIPAAQIHENMLGSRGIAPLFLTFALNGGEWPSLCPYYSNLG